MDWVIVAATMVIAFSAITSLWLNWRLSQDNRALRKAGTEPEVVAYLAPLGKYRAFFHLVLQNVGQGPARDVEIFVDAEPSDFDGFDVQEVVPGMRRKVRSLLPQGVRVEVMMGVHHKLSKNEGKDVLPAFYVEVAYTNLRGVAIPPRRHKIDVSEFSGRFLVNNPEVEMADAVQKIEKHLDHFASGFNRLHVETITTAEQQAADEERYGRWKERSAAKAEEEEAS